MSKSNKCPTCGMKMEMYYTVYCPKCDIQTKIHDKRGSINLFVLYNYMELFIDGFKAFEDEYGTLTSILEDSGGNDSFHELSLGEFDNFVPLSNDPEDQMDEYEKSLHSRDMYIRKACDMLGIDHSSNNLFCWISW